MLENYENGGQRCRELETVSVGTQRDCVLTSWQSRLIEEVVFMEYGFVVLSWKSLDMVKCWGEGLN